MKYSRLGRTELEVSTIGIGTEHLNGQSRQTVVSVIREAIEGGINYFDLIFSLPDYLDKMAVAFSGLRDLVFLTAHLGSTERNGQYLKSRSVRRCTAVFHEVLARLGIDHVDVLFLHNFNSTNDWDRVAKPGGVFDLALQLQEEGRTRFVGISGHYVRPIRKAVQTGQVDVVMFPVNLFGHAMPGRQELLELCTEQDIGVVAMKPFGGGRLLTQRGPLRVPKYQTGGEAYKANIGSDITPAQCLSYVLSQVGVSMALPGVKNRAELAAALHASQTAEADRDFGQLLAEFGRYVEGECVYCSHCLPCPAVIDIGQVNRFLDAAQIGFTERLRGAYDALPMKASSCTECGACVERCPFGVEVIVRIRQAAALFERVAAA